MKTSNNDDKLSKARILSARIKAELLSFISAAKETGSFPVYYLSFVEKKDAIDTLIIKLKYSHL